MMEYTLGEIVNITQGRLLPDSPPEKKIHGLATDSRKMQAGSLFVALQGPTYDGHDFTHAALAGGAAATLVHRPVPGPGVLVGNTLQALQALAADWRQRLPARILGITGSCGKTTVKEVLAAILQEQGPTLSTQGNLNNHIGVPLTLARLGPEHRFAVVEMGMNHAGELTILSRLARPDLVLINNAGAAHLEGLGSIAAVAAAKGEILLGLSSTGIAILNGDDPFVEYWAQRAPGEVWRFSLSDRPVRVRGQWQAQGTGGEMLVQAPQGSFSFKIPLPGRHNGANVLAAVTAALALEVPVHAIVRAVAQLQGVPGRLQWKTGPAHSRILDDSYNANPSSLEAALQVLAQQPGNRILVLGDMAELGPDTELYHRQAGQRARELGIDALFALGPWSAAAAAGFGSDARHYDSQEVLVQELWKVLDAHSTVLVKGSRTARMEQVVRSLTVEEG